MQTRKSLRTADADFRATRTTHRAPRKIVPICTAPRFGLCLTIASLVFPFIAIARVIA